MHYLKNVKKYFTEVYKYFMFLVKGGNNISNIPGYNERGDSNYRSLHSNQYITYYPQSVLSSFH